jgi:hypothetical protein
MFTQEEFRQWCQQLGLKETTARAIADIRSEPPTRRVTSRVGNVSGRYPSRKMGVTIQFESHTVELAGIYQMEYDSDVLEYYDQPPSIQLLYQSSTGRRVKAEANRRMSIIAPYLEGRKPKDDYSASSNDSVSSRTIRRWLAQWREAERNYGYGYLGLLPRTHQKGNRNRKLPRATQLLISEFIANE